MKSAKAQVAVTQTKRPSGFLTNTSNKSISLPYKRRPPPILHKTSLCLRKVGLSIANVWWCSCSRSMLSSGDFVGFFSHWARFSRYPSSMQTFADSLFRAMVHSYYCENPGNDGWTPEIPQQAAFPCQMLSEGFWAATHLPLNNPSSLALEQHWVTSTVAHVTCVLSWAIGIVTSTVRIKQLREVCACCCWHQWTEVLRQNSVIIDFTVVDRLYRIHARSLQVS